MTPLIRSAHLRAIDFARELSDFQLDHASIQDAFESEMLDDEISDTRARSVASAVIDTASFL